MKVERASAWADAVFHVLAHVDVAGAASCFSPVYGAWIAGKLGPPEGRELAEDARVLAQLARGRDLGREPVLAFAQAQAIAWIFRSVASVHAGVDGELGVVAVDDDAARSIAVAAGPIAEVLRAAAELELPRLEALPALVWDRDDVEAALARVAAAAPLLARCTVAVTPALGLRGRVHDAYIFVGVPGVAGATAEHVAWQAAHEATVDEVGGEEARALGLLRSRARRVGLGDEHARWLAHLDLSAIGAIPDVEDGA